MKPIFFSVLMLLAACDGAPAPIGPAGGPGGPDGISLLPGGDTTQRAADTTPDSRPDAPAEIQPGTDSYFDTLAEVTPSVCPTGQPGEVLFEFQGDGAVIGVPAVGDDGTVYFGTMNATFYAVSCSGDLLWEWRYECEPPMCPQAFEGAPALGDDGTIFIGDDIAIPNYLFALTTTGEMKWLYETQMIYGSMDSSPVLGDSGEIFIGAHGYSGYSGALGQLVGVDSNGEALPGFPIPGGPITASPLMVGGVLVVPEGGETDPEELIAYNAAGEELWRRTLTEGAWMTEQASVGLDNDGFVYSVEWVDMGTDMAPYTILRRHDPKTGDWDWQVEIMNTQLPVGAPVSRTGVFGLHVILAFQDGRVVDANPYSGGVIWSDILPSADFGDAIGGGPVLADDGFLYVPRPVNWTTDMPFAGIARVELDGPGAEPEIYMVGSHPDRVSSSLQITNGGALIFGTDSGKVFAVASAATGPDPSAAWPSFRGNSGNTGNAD